MKWRPASSARQFRCLNQALTLEQVAEAKGLFAPRVTWVHHWTPDLFSFRVERPQSLVPKSLEDCRTISAWAEATMPRTAGHDHG